MNNAELWSKKGNERTALMGWLKRHNVEFDINAGYEELRRLYIDKECGRI